MNTINIYYLKTIWSLGDHRDGLFMATAALRQTTPECAQVH